MSGVVENVEAGYAPSLLDLRSTYVGYHGGGASVSREFDRGIAAHDLAVRVAALEEAAAETYDHTTIGQNNERTVTQRPVLSKDVRDWLLARAAAIRVEGAE